MVFLSLVDAVARRWNRLVVLQVLLAVLALPVAGRAEEKPAQFIDLSLLVAQDYPCTWPNNNFPMFQINNYRRIGPTSAYNSDILCIDGNTGTQLDFPPHSIPLPDSKLANAGRFGSMFSDKVPAWQFGGEACIVDCKDLLDSAPKGRSDLVKREKVMAWEKKVRPLGPGDVVLFHSGYTDKYYKPFPAGRRFIADPLDSKAPAWPDPDPDCMEYLATRKVMTLGCDSPSMGPIPDLAEPTHIAGLKHGMIWTESAANLGKLPITGAFYCCIGPKHAAGAYSEGRAFAVVGDPLAKRLIESCRKKQVIDLSVMLDPELPVWWPGRGSGDNRHLYMRIGFMPMVTTGYVHQTHTLDSHTGTHLVPPAYALPPKKFNPKNYAPNVREWLAEYEQKYGPRGVSDLTTEKVPIQQTCGPVRIIDLKDLALADQSKLPASPEVTKEAIQSYETKHDQLHAGDIVILHTGWSDKYLKPFPAGKACMEDPLNGKSEGWPALGADAVVYLAEKGIRCVATDAPTLGGVDPKQALMTYWALGSKGIVGVEFLTNVGKLPENAYFLFAATKIRGCHGGPGRAIALY